MTAPTNKLDGAMMTDEQKRAALNAIHEFLGIAKMKIYPQPDKPESDWAKLKAAVDGLALLSASKPAAPQYSKNIEWPEGYCLDPNGVMCCPDGAHKHWSFGYDLGYADALAIRTPAAPAQSGEPVADTGNAQADRIINRLSSSDPDFDDCIDAVAFIRKLVAEHKGPDGFATWKDAAITERMRRVKSEGASGHSESLENLFLEALDFGIGFGPRLSQVGEWKETRVSKANGLVIRAQHYAAPQPSLPAQSGESVACELCKGVGQIGMPGQRCFACDGSGKSKFAAPQLSQPAQSAVVQDDERETSEALLAMSDAMTAWRSEAEKYHQITSLSLSAFSDGYEAGVKAILSAQSTSQSKAPCIRAHNPKNCERRPCYLENKCADDDLSPRHINGSFEAWASEYGFHAELLDVHQYAKEAARDAWNAARAASPQATATQPAQTERDAIEQAHAKIKAATIANPRAVSYLLDDALEILEAALARQQAQKAD